MAKGTRARRAKRIAATYLGEFIDQCQQAEVERENFRRSWSGGFGYNTDRDNGVQYITTPLGTHRDADALGESNWSVISSEMEKADSFGHVSEHSGSFVHSEGSALCGWMESIVVRMDDAVALKAAYGLVDRLQNHPVLDEDDYSDREYKENHPSTGGCYAEDCNCEAGEHDRVSDRDGEHEGCRAWLLGKLQSQAQEGWRGFEGSDVSEEHEDLSEMDHDQPENRREYINSMTARGIGTESDTFTVYEPEHNRLTSWMWFCGADGCGTWIEATLADLIQIKRHRLFSDIPIPAGINMSKDNVQLMLPL